MSVGEILSKSAERYGQKIALVCDNGRLSYRELDESSNRMAWSLSNMGIQKGDRLAILLPNCLEYVIGFYAAVKIGAIAVPMDRRLREVDGSHILSDSKPKILITSLHFLDRWLPKAKELKSIQQIITIEKTERSDIRTFEETVSEGIPIPIQKEVQDEDLATLIYISADIGRPKGVMLSHGNIVSNLDMIAKALSYVDSDLGLTCLPLNHAFGLIAACLAFHKVGATSAIYSRFNAFKLIKAIHEERATVFEVVPYILAKIAEIPKEEMIRYDLSSIRLVVSAGEKLTQEIMKAFRAKSGLDIYEGYGKTETTGVVSFNKPGGKASPGMIGKVVDGIEWKIMDDKGNVLPPGKVGELLIRGPGVMQGYYNLPELTSKAIEDGWLHTQDMVWADKEGNLTFVDVKTNMIIVGGSNVFPREVEEFLLSHPAVREARVVWVSDQYWGKVPKALIVTKEKSRISKEEIIGYCKDGLASYKVPRYVEFVTSLDQPFRS